MTDTGGQRFRVYCHDDQVPFGRYATYQTSARSVFELFNRNENRGISVDFHYGPVKGVVNAVPCTLNSRVKAIDSAFMSEGVKLLRTTETIFSVAGMGKRIYVTRRELFQMLESTTRVF